MSTDNAKDDLSLEMSLEEMALEVVDMLDVQENVQLLGKMR